MLASEEIWRRGEMTAKCRRLSGAIIISSYVASRRKPWRRQRRRENEKPWRSIRNIEAWQLKAKIIASAMKKQRRNGIEKPIAKGAAAAIVAAKITAAAAWRQLAIGSVASASLEKQLGGSWRKPGMAAAA
jgi:hypothetical protein